MYELVEAARLRGTIPITKWTAVFTVLGIGVCLLSWRWLARRTGWRRWPTLGALLSLAAALALTVSPRGGRSRNRRTLAECLPADWADLGRSAGKVGDSVESLLNVGLLVPLGFTLVLACRRVAWPAALMLLLPAAIELAQTSINGRQCTPADWMANALGGLVGVGAGLLVHRWWQARERTPLPAAANP
ncbi:VanZ family protein [Pseudonocardia acaciae]|uniref:VanZ family protein n=1 Tax=Pseudonocardia acaciae TaxID=551276 RepID=UPI0005694A76|nr:VanZ family protein [Pseudonocardia acaciae]